MSNKNISIVKSFAIIGSSTFLNMLIGVLTTPIITRLVQPEKYGQLSMFLLYTNMAVTILCFGLDQALIRFYYEKEDVVYKSTLLRKCTRYPFSICVVMCALLCVLSNARIILTKFSNSAVFFLCINIIVHLIYRFSLLMIRLEKNSKLYGLLQVVYKLAYVFFALILLILTDVDDFLILVIATMVSSIICVISSICNQKKYWFQKQLYYEKVASDKELISYSYPFIFSMGVTILFQAADKMALNMYCSYAEIGVYSSAMSLVSIFAIVQTTFNTMWSPMAMEHYAKRPEDKSLYTQANRIITVLMYFLGLSLILCKDFFAILLGEEYREAAFLLPFLIFNPIMYTISETTYLGLVFKKKSKMQVVVVLVPCVVNITGNMILVPRLGGVGAAVSTGISYIVFFMMRTLISSHYYPVDYKLKPFLIETAFVLLYALYNTMHTFNIISVVGYGICIFVLFCLYRDTVLLCFDYIKDLLENFRQKGYAKLHKD